MFLTIPKVKKRFLKQSQKSDDEISSDSDEFDDSDLEDSEDSDNLDNSDSETTSEEDPLMKVSKIYKKNKIMKYFALFK